MRNKSRDVHLSCQAVSADLLPANKGMKRQMIGHSICEFCVSLSEHQFCKH